MKLIIIFFGLIVHVNQPWSLDNTAVLPDDLYHKAEMRIPLGAVVHPDADWIKDWCKSDPCVIPLKGLHVRVNGTRGMFSHMSDDLVSSLPSLTRLSPGCHGLRQEVRKRTAQDNQLAAFIDYRGGQRGIEKHYATKAAFPETPWGQPRCLACKVKYEADLDGNTTTLIFTETKTNTVHEVEVNGSASGTVITVSNLPDPNQEEHFALHYRIFEADGGCKAAMPLIHDELTCDEPTCKKDDYIAVARGAAPFPQADCTNTGYP